ncbi:hypothetical protein [Algivirga pacifica]|uniref:DUF4251 domain-containing protein n=1 Tax=Algivirga pacifica TaxID=1162670 RepID=A0ABP9DKF3_9BACT
MINQFYFLGFVACLLYLPCKAQEHAHQKLQEELSEYGRRLKQEGRFHGSISIGSTKELIYQQSIGLANRSWNIPIQKDTRFDIASLNKSFIEVQKGELLLTGVSDSNRGMVMTYQQLEEFPQ